MRSWQRSPSPAAWSTNPARDTAVNIDELGRAIGHLCWVERQLFSLLGSWASALPVVEAKAMLGTHSAQHAWHAQLWRDRIPEPNGADGERLVDGTHSPAAEVLAVLSLDDGVEPLARMAGVYVVLLPWLAREVEAVIAGTSVDTDATTVRICSLVGADVRLASRDGDELVQSLMITSAEMAASAAMCATIIELLDDAPSA
jgi:hypothetical protein